MTQNVPLIGDGIFFQVCLPETVMLKETEIHNLRKFKERKILPLNQPQPEPVSEESSKGWSHEMICLLLASMSANYHNFCNQLTRESAYRAIIEEFRNHGYEVNKTPIKRKWNSLLTTYRRTRDRLKSNGESKQTWVYYDHIDEILQKSSKEITPPPMSIVESFHFEENGERTDEKKPKSSYDIEHIEIKSEIQEHEVDEEKDIFTKEHEENIQNEMTDSASSSVFIKEECPRNGEFKRKNNTNDPVRKKRKMRTDEITLKDILEYQKQSAQELNDTINLAANAICSSLQSLKTDIVNAILQMKS